MISKTFVTAFVATCLVAGSSASPCKVSSRTTEASTTAGASTTIVSAETTTATEKASSTAEDTTTAISSVVLSSTEQLSVTVTVSENSVETTLATTTAISSSKDSSIADSTTTEAESTVTSIESVATTTDGTTTAVATTTEATTTTEAATTTTAEATSVPTFIANTGFEDSFDAVAAWSLYAPNSGVALDLDTNVHHEGQNSARLTYSQAGQNFAQQQLHGPIMAGVTYAMSAWFRTSEGCSTAYLLCAYQGNQFVDGVSFRLTLMPQASGSKLRAPVPSMKAR